MTFERRKPSVDLRAFLDPLKPGSYFDCGEARLGGIDVALEEEALRRGRPVGEDSFQLVATDGGLIYCRASIMFAIAARWKDLTIGRPEDGAAADESVLPVTWPTHGDLRFTVSRRLGSNIFRRWLQLQAQATRRSQVEQDVRFERTRAFTSGSDNGDVNGHDGRANGWNGEANGVPVNGRNGDDARPGTDDANGEADHAVAASNGATHDDVLDLRPATEAEPTVSFDPLATIDEAVVDDWVDDRVPATSPSSSTSPSAAAPPSTTTPVRIPPERSDNGDDPTADPFNGHPIRGDAAVDPVADPAATHFMRRTVDGTEIFPDQRAGRDGGDFGRSVVDAPSLPSGDGGGSRNGPLGVPVPEISGARLQRAAGSPDSVAVPRLDIRSTLLAGRRESEWIEALRRRQVFILGLVTILALAVIALIGFFSGGDNGDIEASAGAVVEAADGDTTPQTLSSDAGPAVDDTSVTPTTTQAAEADQMAAQSTVPTLRVSSTAVQICHSNYGGCVPVAADVDCEGDGDGPAFQVAPVAVFGDDVYELDTDNDREACEPDQPRASVDADDG